MKKKVEEIIEFTKHFPWESGNKEHSFRANLNKFVELTLNKKKYKILKEVKYYDRKWRSYPTAFSVGGKWIDERDNAERWWPYNRSFSLYKLENIENIVCKDYISDETGSFIGFLVTDGKTAEVLLSPNGIPDDKLIKRAAREGRGEIYTGSYNL